ncbi:TPA: hypothetical protein LA742_000711 [Clostridium botulinum]|nr:hypothetical protein [Clostridium botulinum]
MGNIAEKANDIRSKTYGKDVREALASGLEEINYVAESANNTSNKAKTIAESVTAAENQRIENENIRKKSEETRVNNETLRVKSEKDRVLNEDERIKKETIRVENENTRVINEDKRLLSEKERQTNETSRNSNENTRLQAENERVNNENIRLTKENERVKNEQNRVVAENSRQVSEHNRVVSEEERVKEWNLIKDSYVNGEANGDMKKIIYDTNDNGIVDLSEQSLDCINSYTKNEVDDMVKHSVVKALVITRESECINPLNTYNYTGGNIFKKNEVVKVDTGKSKPNMHANTNIIDNNIYTSILAKDFIIEELKNKVNAVEGKQLSTEDYTTVEKQKLTGIEAGANKYIHPNDLNTRHVTDTQIKTWNSKAEGEKYTDTGIEIDDFIIRISGEDLIIKNKKNDKGLALKPDGNLTYDGRIIPVVGKPNFRINTVINQNTTYKWEHHLGYKPFFTVSTTIGNVNPTIEVTDTTIRAYTYQGNECRLDIDCW